MSPFLSLAIVIIILLVVLFIVSYILNKRTPVPEGCQEEKITDEFCINCSNTECKIYEKLNEIKEELKEEKE